MTVKQSGRAKFPNLIFDQSSGRGREGEHERGFGNYDYRGPEGAGHFRVRFPRRSVF